MKTSLAGFDSIFEQWGERICEVEDRWNEIIQSEEQKEKREMNRASQTSRIQLSIGIYAQWESQSKKKGRKGKKICEDIITKIFPNLTKNINL